MSAKPRFKPRVGWAEDFGHNFTVDAYKSEWKTTRVRVVDARDLTPEKAVEILCQWEYACMADVGGPNEDIKLAVQCVEEMAAKCGMTASVVNGKVRVRRAKT